jgi:hypothetical protein
MRYVSGTVISNGESEKYVDCYLCLKLGSGGDEVK